MVTSGKASSNCIHQNSLIVNSALALGFCFSPVRSLLEIPGPVSVRWPNIAAYHMTIQIYIVAVLLFQRSDEFSKNSRKTSELVQTRNFIYFSLQGFKSDSI